MDERTRKARTPRRHDAKTRQFRWELSTLNDCNPQCTSTRRQPQKRTHRGCDYAQVSPVDCLLRLGLCNQHNLRIVSSLGNRALLRVGGFTNDIRWIVSRGKSGIKEQRSNMSLYGGHYRAWIYSMVSYSSHRGLYMCQANRAHARLFCVLYDF